jgi:PadR family transcriptional regulator, regulatory protein PadR
MRCPHRTGRPAPVGRWTRLAPPATLRRMEPGGDSNRTLTQLRRGALPHCVLAVLADGERYGFELIGVLAEARGLAISEGTIYPLLSRLRREGLVETTWQESDSGPPRRYYRLTADGERALVSFREDWRSYRDAVDELLGTGGRG